ncbi:uncharacterized protein LOC126895759 [Daktulosphaira vitifoliae]|uniref:uncharacterized protein LOC126895759 n=1 Tax=Daktulosphaira vitifoliae TaxID=58002 RepID=UPI0021AA12C5|nr:uncharacterized protein LOC126895759 [Daktulosphaira vitifoliae]
MGCSPSHFGLSYLKKTKKKKNKSKDSDEEKSDGSMYENQNIEQIQLTSTPSINNLCGISEFEDSSPLQQRISGIQNSTSLFINSQLSTSQLNFFKMLDEKIEMGSDYIQSIEELQLEKMHRTQAMLVKWEQARVQNSPKSYLKNQSNFLHNTLTQGSNSIIQFDQEQYAFHTELI